MATDIGSVRERIASLLDEIQGAKAAYPYMPRNVEPGNMPMFLVVPAAAEHDSAANTLHRTQRLYRLILLIAPVTLGIYGTSQKLLDPFFERVEDKFIANAKLNALDAEIVNAEIVEDSGEGVIEFPPGSGQRYVGAEWALLVETKRAVTTGT